MAALVIGGFALCYWFDAAETFRILKVMPDLSFLTLATGVLAWAGYRRVLDLLSVFLWVIVVALLSDPLIHITGSTPFPMIDRALVRFDFVSTGALVHWVRAHAAVSFASSVVYWSALPLLVCALFLPSLLGRREAGYRFVLAGTLCVYFTAAIFARFPAAGPWTAEGYQPTAEQAQVSLQLAKLKAHTAVGKLKTGAVVSFPSFHSILAILCAFALWPIRWARWPAVVVAAGICLSTVTTGWHYGIDVIAGVIVAVTCQGAAALVLPSYHGKSFFKSSCDGCRPYSQIS